MHRSTKWQFEYDTGSFKHEDCFAYLIEANPAFKKNLEPLRTSRVFPMPQVACYMCDKPRERFYLDLNGPDGWGSSLNSTHESVKATSRTQAVAVDVRLDNLNRLLVENAIPEDTVIVKMDIEGAEWDVLPCLANSPAASLVDTLYLEDHCPGGENGWCPTNGQAGNTRQTFENAKQTLVSKGVNIPAGYWSPML